MRTRASAARLRQQSMLGEGRPHQTSSLDGGRSNLFGGASSPNAGEFASASCHVSGRTRGTASTPLVERRRSQRLRAAFQVAETDEAAAPLPVSRTCSHCENCTSECDSAPDECRCCASLREQLSLPPDSTSSERERVIGGEENHRYVSKDQHHLSPECHRLQQPPCAQSTAHTQRLSPQHSAPTSGGITTARVVVYSVIGLGLWAFFLLYVLSFSWAQLFQLVIVICVAVSVMLGAIAATAMFTRVLQHFPTVYKLFASQRTFRIGHHALNVYYTAALFLQIWPDVSYQETPSVFWACCLIPLVDLISSMIYEIGCVQSDPGWLTVSKEELEPVWRSSPQYCSTCNIIRPLRAKHCNTCGRCVERLDHHCPYTNNCVGLLNHRFFILMLCWEVVHILTNFFPFYYSLLYMRENWDVSTAHMALLVCFGGYLLLMVVGLLVYQTNSIVMNLTTNEILNRHRYRYLDLDASGTTACSSPVNDDQHHQEDLSGQDQPARRKHRFDRGWLRNCMSFFSLRPFEHERAVWRNVPKPDPDSGAASMLPRLHSDRPLSSSGGAAESAAADQLDGVNYNEHASERYLGQHHYLHQQHQQQHQHQHQHQQQGMHVNNIALEPLPEFTPGCAVPDAMILFTPKVIASHVE
eukprot:CAMPEP_0177674560 /NCGR_PEP_ID=MMETSP0447-20121125/26633_1 /TAXON_ID=0 /ORGANISM="Stygamoeba regulata, Strain BSH-02190019" /LENGTH=640 /DNA_ID=CAMNT_0019182689 /DNA_START=38 /DNA_END=1960 /DNA_ORIENTATION=+